jgi:hypothetical protein
VSGKKDRPKPSELIQYKNTKSLGGGDGHAGTGMGLQPGQAVLCVLLDKEPGGYAVNIPLFNQAGYLETGEKFKIGQQVLGEFVCFHHNRAVLVPKMGGDKKSVSHRLPEIKIQRRRTLDIIMPSVSEQPPKKFMMSEMDLSQLLNTLERQLWTGCLKVLSETHKSRSSMILFRGRVVGCIYGKQGLSEPLSTEPSLKMMLNDMHHPQTIGLMYELPEAVCIAMGALFLGYPVDRSDGASARAYLDYMLERFSHNKDTACLVFNFPSNGATCLAFMHHGLFAGSFLVDDQKYSTDIQDLYQLLANDSKARAEASMIPAQMTSGMVRFGFSLSETSRRL